jgi:hypothetical protein
MNYQCRISSEVHSDSWHIQHLPMPSGPMNARQNIVVKIMKDTHFEEVPTQYSLALRDWEQHFLIRHLQQFLLRMLAHLSLTLADRYRAGRHECIFDSRQYNSHEYHGG